MVCQIVKGTGFASEKAQEDPLWNPRQQTKSATS